MLFQNIILLNTERYFIVIIYVYMYLHECCSPNRMPQGINEWMSEWMNFFYCRYTGWHDRAMIAIYLMMMRWIRWDCPADTGFENWALLVTDTLHITKSWMKCFVSLTPERGMNEKLWRERPNEYTRPHAPRPIDYVLMNIICVSMGTFHLYTDVCLLYHNKQTCICVYLSRLCRPPCHW